MVAVTWVMRAFFVSSVVFLTLLGLSVPFVEPGTASFTISVLSTLMLGFVLIASAVCIALHWDPFEVLLS